MTLAINEGKSTADILERWQLRIEDGEQGSAVYLAEREETPNLEQAMYKSPMTDFGDFYDDISKNENTKDRYFAEDINGIGLDIPRNTIIHDKNKHNLSKEEWQGIIEAIKNNQIKEARIGDYSRMRGIPVKMVVDVNGLEYGVAFDHMKSGRNLVGSAFVLEDKGWINEKQKKSSQMEAYKPLPNSSSLGNSMSEIISALDNNVNDTLYQLPQEAYGADGKADINTPEFKRWFGDSKVVDENGQPKTYWHGSLWNFDTFKQSNGDYNFSPDEKFAYEYAESKAFEQGIDRDVVTYPVYIKSEKPFDFENMIDVDFIKNITNGKEIRVFGNKKTQEEFIDEIQGYYQDTPLREGEFEKITQDGFPKWYSKYNENIDYGQSSVNEYKVLEVNEREGYFIAAKPPFRVDIDDVESEIKKKIKDIDFGKEETAVEISYETPYGERVGNAYVMKVYKPSVEHRKKGADNWIYLESAEIDGVDFIDILKENGYDGYYKVENGIKNLSVFSPNQIKSVNNRGTFDPASDNIYYQTGEGHRGRGYVGYSMSVNMKEAQENNELPASKAAKALGVSTQAIRETLSPSAWHHASSYYNKVDVYDINPYLELKAGRELSEDEYTPEEIEDIKSNWEKIKSMPKPDKTTEQFYGDAEWLEWGGTRKHPTAKKHKYDNILIEKKGSFYTFHLPDGTTVRKKIDSNGTFVVSEEKKAQDARSQYLRDEANRVRGDILRKHRPQYEAYIRENKLDKPGFDEFEKFEVESNFYGDNYYISGQKPYSEHKETGLRRLHREGGKYELQEWDGENWQVLETRDNFIPGYGNYPKTLGDFASDDPEYQAFNEVYVSGDEDAIEQFINQRNNGGVPRYQGQVVDNGNDVKLTIDSQEEVGGLSEDDFKLKMLDTLKSFKGKKIFNQSLNGEIEIRTSSIKKYKSFFADKNKRLIVPYVPELLERANFVNENTYTPETESNIVAYWKADLPINIDSDTYNVHLTVKEDNNGNFFWDAQVNEKAPRTDPATNPGDKGLSTSADTAVQGGLRGAKAETAYTDNITQPGSDVNDTLYQIQEYDDLKSTNTVGDVKKLLKGLKSNEEIRLMYDKNKHYWFAIDADNYIHQDMITKAFKQGLYPEFDSSYEAQQYFDENYNVDNEYLIRFKAESYSSKDDLQNILQDKLNQDEYKVAYSLGDENGKGYVVFARSLYDLSETPLKTIGKDAEVWSRNPYMMTEIKKLSVEDLAQEGIFYQTADGELNLEVTPVRRQGEDNPRGSFTRRPDTGEAIIRIFQTADASTVVHELGHFFLDDMRRFADNPETAAQLEAIYRYVGSTDGNLTREQHEYFADSFEAYLLEGRSPNALLKKVFRRFKSWLRNLYNEVKRLEYVKLDDEIRKTFDDMLGGRKIDFAMQQSTVNMENRLQRGFISNWDINKAMELLHEGKISKAEMQSLIDQMKSNEVSAVDFKQKLKDFAVSPNINKEKLSEYDYNLYRRQLENLVFDRENVRSRIERLLTWTKPRTQNGKLVGRFPDKKLNDAFDRFRELVAMDKDAAKEQQQENAKLIEEFMREGGDIDVEKLVFENKLLGLATGKISDRALLEVYEGLSDSYNAGRLSAMITGEIRKERKARLIAEAEEVLTGGGRINWRDEKKGWKDKAWKMLGGAERGQLSWGGLMDVLSRNDKASKSSNSKLSQNMDIFNAEQKMYAGIIKDGDNVSEKLMNALKGSANKAISVSRYMDKELDQKTMIEWVGNENIGKRGLPVRPILMRKEFSKDQLIDVYMKAQDKDTREIMAADPINQYNEEFLRRVNEELTEDDIAVAKALFEFYNENYERFNQFYEDHFGISLTHNKFYSPRSMTRNGVNVDDGTPRAYASFSGAKQRVAQAGSATINFRGAFAALHKYVQDLNHYMGFADALLDINAVFGDKKIKAIIDNVFGAKMNERIRYEIGNFANNGEKKDVWSALSKVRARYAKSVLGLKPALAIKQLTSFPAYWENVSTTDFIKGVADFFLHPKEAMEILGNTTLMKSRDVNIIRDFEVMSKSEMFKNMKKAKGKFKWNDFLMANIKFGDRGAIYMGGWALYKSELKKNLKAGMSETEAKQKALDTFERVTDETQQSGRLSQQSYMQSNAMWRAFTKFTSSQNQYLRKEIMAVNGLLSGRMSKKQVAKMLFIYHFLLPMFFQFVADSFRWDDDSQMRAAALGSLNGWFLINKVLENVYNTLTGQGGMYQARMSVRELVPFWGSLEDFKNMVLKFADEDLEAEDVLKAVKTLGELTGLPLKYVQDVVNNFGDYAKAGEPGKEIMLWLGWSPYALRDFEDE